MENKSLQKSSWFESFFSIALILLLMHVFYAAWLHVTNEHINYQIEATKAAGDLTPSWALAALRDGGYVSTLTASLLLASNKIAYLVLGVAVGFFVTRYISEWGGKRSPVPVKQPNIYGGESSDIYVTLPALGTGAPIVEHFLRIDRTKLPTNRPPGTPIEKLELAVQELLAAHRHWPADPEGHHANTPLYDHSIDVARRMRAKVSDPLARLLGLSHDLGKLIAYQANPKRPNAWVVMTKTHDQMSSNIVRLLPEFKALSAEDQETLKTVLKYYHNPQAAPARTSQRARVLIQKLRFADSLVTYENQQTPKSLSGDEAVVSAVAEAVMEVVPTLNVNRVRADVHADGFTGIAYDYVAILEYPIRLGLASHIKDERIVRALALRTDRTRGQLHPASEVIFKAMERTGILFATYNGITPELGRFTIVSGNQTYSDCYLLNRAKLEKIFPEVVAHWGEVPPYKLRVKGASRGGVSPDDDPDTTSSAPTPPSSSKT